jgi:hypothetical protein
MTFEAPPPPPRRTGLVLGLALGGVAVVGALGILLSFASRRSAPAPVANPATSTPTPIASVTAVTAPPEPVVAPVATPDATPTPSAEPEDLTLAPGEGELRVECAPVACTNIAIDGRVGTNRGPFALKAGKHGIGVSTPGYGGLWEMVTVTAGERTVQRFALSPARSAPAKSCGKFLDRCN